MRLVSLVRNPSEGAKLKRDGRQHRGIAGRKLRRASKSPGKHASARREASAVCPRRRDRTGRRRQRARCPPDRPRHQATQPRPRQGRAARRNLRRGKGSPRYRVAVRRARRPYDRQLSKYHAASSYRAIRRSMRVIMMETKFGGGACDCGVVPGLKILSGRRRGAGRPLDFQDEQVASMAEFPSVNQAIRACPARRRRRWARTGVRIPTPGSSIPSATAAGH